MMAISEYYTNEELISQLRMFFDSEEDIDFNSCLSQIIEIDENTFELKIKSKTFKINKILCNVTEEG